jgi:hypothetical protein
LKNHFSKKFRGKWFSVEKNVWKIGPRWVCENIAQNIAQKLPKVSKHTMERTLVQSGHPASKLKWSAWAIGEHGLFLMPDDQDALIGQMLN